MTEANWLILTWDSKIWITEDQKTKIKFHRVIGPDDGFFRYSINGDLKKIPRITESALDDKSFTFRNVKGTWGVKTMDDNSINVFLPEINNMNFHQIDDLDEIK